MSKIEIPEEKLAGISERIKAMISDSIILVALLFLITYIFSLFNYIPDNVRIIAFAFIFILYDPILTSAFGGTLGHMAFGVRVKRENNLNRNIPFIFAFIRYLVKISLGWISLITVSTNIKHKAIHDYIVGSVVIYS